jgi:hypothetical protein
MEQVGGLQQRPTGTRGETTTVLLLVFVRDFGAANNLAAYL